MIQETEVTFFSSLESRGYGLDDVNGVVGMDSLGGVGGVDGVALADHVDEGDKPKSYREGVGRKGGRGRSNQKLS